jgi:hypothetical protein
MKKIITLLVVLIFSISIISAALAETAQSVQNQITSLEKEITKLEAKLATTKNKVQRTRLERTIAGHRKVIEEMQADLPQEKAPVVAVPAPVVAPAGSALPRMLAVKGGLAGGAGLAAVEYLLPVGPVYLGGEAGYAIGNNFGVIDVAGRCIYNVGNNYIGLEIGYAGYSKDVTNVPGLSGTIKAGIGVGVIGEITMGPVQLGLGYNTALGLRADAGYRMYL